MRDFLPSFFFLSVSCTPREGFSMRAAVAIVLLTLIGFAVGANLAKLKEEITSEALVPAQEKKAEAEVCTPSKPLLLLGFIISRGGRLHLRFVLL